MYLTDKFIHVMCQPWLDQVVRQPS